MIEIPPKSYRQFETFFSENTVISKIISSGWGGGGESNFSRVGPNADIYRNP